MGHWILRFPVHDGILECNRFWEESVKRKSRTEIATSNNKAQ